MKSQHHRSTIETVQPLKSELHTMTIDRMVAIAVCGLVCVLYSYKHAAAGWFGPSNYNECLIDKMKGQNALMMPRAAAECLTQFACNAEARNDFRQCLERALVIDAISVDTCSTEAAKYCKQ